MGGTHGLSIIFTRTQVRCTQWQLTECRKTFFCEKPNSTEERGSVCCFSGCGCSWGQPNSGGNELNLEGFEMSEDKPCSDPWPNAQLYSPQRTPRSPGSEAVAAANGKEGEDGRICCCLAGHSWWLALRVGSLLHSYRATLEGSCGLLLNIFITQITEKQRNRRMWPMLEQMNSQQKLMSLSLNVRFRNDFKAIL